MAIERAITAWARTVTSRIGFGFTISRFFERLNSTDGAAPAARPDSTWTEGGHGVMPSR
jgi:uncharacterized membrane protein YidH (DUF202 family)